MHFPTKLATLLRGDKTIIIWLLISDQMKMPNVDKLNLVFVENVFDDKRRFSCRIDSLNADSHGCGLLLLQLIIVNLKNMKTVLILRH